MSWLRRRRLGIVPGWNQAAEAAPTYVPPIVELAIRIEDVAIRVEQHLQAQAAKPEGQRNTELMNALLELRTALGPSAVPSSARLAPGPQLTATDPLPTRVRKSPP